MNPAATETRHRFYHVWFSTKGRKPALVDEIDQVVKAAIRQAASRTEVDIVEIESGLDHMHLLISLTGGQTLPTVMHDLKGASARQAFSRFPELRLDMASNSFWQKSYGSRLVPREQLEIVRRYIRTQSDRPLRHL